MKLCHIGCVLSLSRDQNMRSAYRFQELAWAASHCNKRPYSPQSPAKFVRRKVPANADHKGDAEYAVGANCKAGDPCSICHTEFAADEVVSQLPCEHCFHDSCIKPWLEVQNTCPICRAELPRSQSSAQAGAGGQQAPAVDVPLNANNFLSGLMPIVSFC